MAEVFSGRSSFYAATFVYLRPKFLPVGNKEVVNIL
jgi:hypothetical protein